MLSIAYSTILVTHYTKTVVFEMTGFPIIIVYRVRAVGFKIISLTTAVIKLRSFLKRIISAHIASRQTKMVF